MLGSKYAGRTKMKLTLACAVIIAAMTLEAATVLAVRPDECEQQRAQYPKVWNDVSGETAIFDCISHYSGALRIKIGDTGGAQRTMMSIVPLTHDSKGVQAEDPSRRVYRIWLDDEQVNRLKTGKYFATIVRKQGSCWIRGDLNGDPIFFLDNAASTPDGPGIGAFYNKAPRISAFKGDAYTCEAIK
jgi:hypothetical protein